MNGDDVGGGTAFGVVMADGCAQYHDLGIISASDIIQVFLNLSGREALAMSKTMDVRSRDEAGSITTDKISIIMFSGTADRFIPLGVISQAAAAMGMEVNIFVTGFALRGFTRKHEELPFPAEFAGMAPALAQGLRAGHVAPWDAMVRQAKELGARVYACSMMAGVMGLGKEDFNDLVDDVVGAATFLQMAENGQTLFI